MKEQNVFLICVTIVLVTFISWAFRGCDRDLARDAEFKTLCFKSGKTIPECNERMPVLPGVAK